MAFFVVKGRGKIGVAESHITLIIPIIPIIKTQKKSLFFKKLFVGLPGFEPGMTGPESVVLPLHHTPIAIARQRYEVFMNGAPDGTKK